MSLRFRSVLATELQAFIRHKRALGFAYERPAGTLCNFDRHLRDLGLTKVANRQWEQIIESWLEQRSGRKSISIASDLQIVRQFCLFRRRYDPAAFVPGSDWAPARRNFHFVPHVFSRSEIQRMLKQSKRLSPWRQCNRCLRLLLLVLYCTGLRFGEAARLRIADVDLKQRLLKIRHSKGRTRLVPFRAELAREFERYLQDHPKELSGAEARVFLNRYGQAHSTKTISSGLRRLMRKVGLKQQHGRGGPRPYDLRHTFAVHRLTRWYRQGVDVAERLPWLSIYMGHVNILGTEIYLTTTPELLALAGRRFERRYRQRSPSV